MKIVIQNNKYYVIKGNNTIYAPLLDGSEAITTMSGQSSPSISNNTLVGGSGYLTQGWDNTGLWKLEFEATGTSEGNGIVLHVGTTSVRDYNLIQLTNQSAVYIYTGSSGTIVNDRYFPNQSSQNMLEYGWQKVTYEKINSTQIKITINGYSKTFTWNLLADYNTINIGVDTWGGTAQLKNIAVTNGDTVIKYYGIKEESNILYQPLLDGTEQITTLQGQTSPTISNNTLTGGSGYLTQGWDNSGLWQLTLEAYGNKSGSGDVVAFILCPPTTTSRDYNEFMVTEGGVVYIYTNGSGVYDTQLQGALTFHGSWTDTITITKTSSTNINIKYQTYEANYTWSELANYSRICIGIDKWSSYYASIKNILVIKV